MEVMETISNLKLHQLYTLAFTKKVILNGDKQILYAHKPRSGKTFMLTYAIEIMKETLNIGNNLNVVILSTTPKETFADIKSNIHQKLPDYHLIDLNTNKHKYDLTKHNNIILASKQFLEPKHDDINFTWFDRSLIHVVFIDECHYGSTTDKSKEMLNRFCGDAFQVFMSATPDKAIQAYHIPMKNIVRWDTKHAQLCKNITKSNNKQELLKDFDSHIMQNVMDKYDDLHIEKSYQDEPDLHILTLQFDKNYSSKSGYSSNALFMINKESNTFEDEKAIIDTLEMILNDNGKVMTKANKIHKANGGLSFYEKENPNNTIIVFLPSKTITSVVQILKYFINQHLDDYYHKRYNFCYLSSHTQKDPLGFVRKKIKESKHVGKRLVIFTGRQLSLAASIAECFMAVALHNSDSFDFNTQSYYRCLTPNSEKKVGFVVVLNPNQVIKFACHTINRYYSGISVDEKLDIIIKQDVLKISDIDCEMNETDVDLHKYQNEMRNLLQNELINSNNFIIYNDLFISNTIKQEIKNIGITSKYKSHVKSYECTINQNEHITSGLIVDTKKNTTKNNEELNINIIIGFIQFLTNIFNILSWKKSIYDIIDLFHHYTKCNDKYQDLIYEWCCNSYPSLDIHKMMSIVQNIIDINKDQMKNEKNTQAIKNAKQMLKESLESNDKKIALNHIVSVLQPNKMEKKVNAEFTTPYALRQDVLNKLPSKLWKKENITFYEPCCGKGGFCVDIFERLFESLKSKIPNDEERKKHILENQLYFADINPGNIYITKLLLDPKKKYKLNYHKGDSLSLDINKKWNIKSVDVCITNPPFNLSTGAARSSSIWHKFVDLAINVTKEKGYIALIHPQGWRNADGKFKNTQKKILERNLIYLEIHDMNDGQMMFHASTPYDWYIMKNSKTNTNLTKVKFANEVKIQKLNLNNYEFIPNKNNDIFKKLIAKPNEEKCIIINDSNYHTLKAKKELKKTSDNVHKYPCVYSVRDNNHLILKWASHNDNGHFNIPKMIWENNKTCVDDKGDYALTQFVYGIVDVPNNLVRIKKVFDSSYFQNLMNDCNVNSQNINPRVIATFRKDFWKDDIFS